MQPLLNFPSPPLYRCVPLSGSPPPDCELYPQASGCGLPTQGLCSPAGRPRTALGHLRLLLVSCLNCHSLTAAPSHLGASHLVARTCGSLPNAISHFSSEGSLRLHQGRQAVLRGRVVPWAAWGRPTLWMEPRGQEGLSGRTC